MAAPRRRTSILTAVVVVAALGLLSLGDREAPEPSSPVARESRASPPPDLPEDPAVAPEIAEEDVDEPRPSPEEAPKERAATRIRGTKLVLVRAVLAKSELEIGEAARVLRTFRNASTGTIRVTRADWRGRACSSVCIRDAKHRARGYQADSRHLKDVTVEPGATIENHIDVELGSPGTWDIEVPAGYLVLKDGGPSFRLKVTVLDHGNAERVRQKAERLARLIETEDPAWPEVWSPAQSELARMGGKAVPHLRRWLRDAESVHLRGIAAKILGRFKARAATDDLVEGLRDIAPTVRRMSLEALGRLKVPETFDAVSALLADRDRWVRVDAVSAVSVFPDERSLSALRARLADGDAMVRQRVAVALARKKDASGIEVLIAALAEDPVDEAGFVVPALEKLTGRSFGDACYPLILSNLDAMEEAGRSNEKVAAEWLAWWDAEGCARYGGD